MRLCNRRKRTGELCQSEAWARYSMGIFAGYHCNKCWEESGYVKAGPESFAPDYAGETLASDDDDPELAALSGYGADY